MLCKWKTRGEIHSGEPEKKWQSKLPYSVTLDTARMDTAVSVKGAWVVVTAG